jgi:GT2 family glycosyltransferase/LmbE family N-acetylglucosaminyl deacetylase
MGGSLLLAASEGIDVVLVVFTDGSLGGTAADEGEFVRLREQEAREAARRLRVKVVHFWRQKDRRLQATPELVDRVAELVRVEKPASVFFPSPLELHPDHRAAAFLVWRGLQHYPDFSGKAYSYEISVQCQANLLIDITSVAEEKAAILAVYRSQLKENDYKGVVQALNKARTYTLPSEVEFAEAFFAYEDVASSDLAALTLSNLRPYWQKALGSTTPLVSVITRTKDRPRMLRKALESVAEQTYPNIEALVLNDGGVDVADVVHGFEGVISRVRYITLSPAKGRSAAANTGLQEAAGQYLMFLDDDDWLYHDHIAKLVDILEREESSGVAYTGVECMSEESPGTWKKVHIFNEPYDPIRLLIQNYIPSHSALFRKHYVDLGCRFDEDLDIYEDWDFWVQMSQRTTFRYVEGISAVYRIGGRGGFGVSGDQALVQHSRIIFFEKWRKLWSAEQLLGIIEYAKCERDVEFLKTEREAMERRTRSLAADLAENERHVQKIAQELEAARRAVAEAKNERDTLKNERNRLQQDIQGLELRLIALEKQIEQSKVEIAHWSGRCHALEDSTAWRLTKPLRLAVTTSKRVFRSTRRTPGRSCHYARRSIETFRHEGIVKLLSRVRSKLGTSLSGSPARLGEPINEPQIVPPNILKVELGDLERLAAEIRFESHAQPLVSVVIPAYNQVEYTVCCLASIQKYLPRCTFEIIVIDDCSTDQTEKLVGSIPNIRYFKNEQNLGFLHSSNKGAALARGKYLMFLNNDTQVSAGWLDALLDAFTAVPGAGAVGSKLIYPSGYLQEAGVALKRDGTVELIGLNDHPDKAQYNSLREVDHCSAASLLMERAMFQDLGRFDKRYAPGYYEDSDLSLRLKECGRKIIYQPASVVIHHLSVSTDGGSGQKMRQIEINKQKYLERWQAELCKLDSVRLIAFYLPQYHPIPENDKWWGKGFTEWTNVMTATPNFEGHYQPRLPGELGFYDLRVPEVREQQAELARAYGVYGFCYYYYWFSGKRLLHRPLDEILKSGKPDFPFCVCWANENWTRRWDGMESEVLIAQNYSETDDLNFIKALVSALRDNRYIRVNGKPLLLVFRVGLLPNPKRTSEIWRDYCLQAGIGDLYLASVESFGTSENPEDFGFDAAVEFPPHSLAVEKEAPTRITNPRFSGWFFDYVATAQRFMSKTPPNQCFRTVMPSWDNTARRQNNAHIFLNTDQLQYERWLRHVVDETRKFKYGDERLVFINAWNEWAEGNYLEPDKRFGRQYLEATLRALDNMLPVSPPASSGSCRESHVPQM